jgi:hypothetical protein
MTIVLAYINLQYINFFQGPKLYFETTIGEESRKYDEVALTRWDLVCPVYDFTTLELVP